MLLEILLNQRKGHQVKQGAGQEAPRSRRAQGENRLRVPNVSWKLPGGALHGVLPGARNDGQGVQSGALEPPNVDHVRRRGTPGAPVGGVVGVVESHAAEAEDEKQASDLDIVVADPESAPNPGVHQNTGPKKEKRRDRSRDKDEKKKKHRDRDREEKSSKETKVVRNYDEEEKQIEEDLSSGDDDDRPSGPPRPADDTNLQSVDMDMSD